MDPAHIHGSMVSSCDVGVLMWRELPFRDHAHGGCNAATPPTRCGRNCRTSL